mmetsp:Transcript_12756/g.32765  ORF Transcript_12756/g.32765 Transcript_12756/m.32765 type:complete len:348 (+) Transcript_12756:96-1139(+)
MRGIVAPVVEAPRALGERRAFAGVQPQAPPRPVTRTAAALRSQEGSVGARSSGLLGGLSAALGVRAALRRRSRPWGTSRRADEGTKAILVKSPKDTYEAMVDKGVNNSEMSVLKIFHASVMGGCYVGLAGLLSLAVAGNLASGASMSAVKFTFAALFPVNLLLVLQSGGQLFTGNSATMAMAYFEGRIGVQKVLKSWVTSYIGNVIGCMTIALVANYTHLLVAGTQELAIATVLKKCGAGFGPTLVKAIMCNWLVCMAVFLCTQANDLTGKMVGIWFPISMFVAIGFEHSVANMFLLPAGFFSGAPLTPLQMICRNLIPVSIGNAIAGAIVVGAGFSFSQGKLGKGL